MLQGRTIHFVRVNLKSLGLKEGDQLLPSPLIVKVLVCHVSKA
jgi:hypothetical protein